MPTPVVSSLAILAADIPHLEVISNSKLGVVAQMSRPRTVRRPPIENPPASVEPGPTVEERLATLQEKLDVLKAQVRQAQQLAGLGTAAAMIAHEVNNLLTPILSYSKAALDADDAALQTKALTVTLKNVRTLVAMSERVLEISAAKPAKCEAVFVRAVVEDAVASLCRDLSKDGIRLVIEVHESLTVWVDPLQLRQVLFNLFLNAREAMAPSHGGRLGISASRQNDKIVIEVRNTGDAIPPGFLLHIFDPFQSSKGPQRDGRTRCGGLGLALCRDLVEENNGTISVTSSPETGTRFTITLPSSEHEGSNERKS